MAKSVGRNSRGGIARVGKNSGSSSSASSKKSNQNYATSLANGGSVVVKNGVKTYSDSPLKVRGNNGISISGESYSRNNDGTGYAPVITPDKLNATSVPDIPTPGMKTNIGDVVGANNAGIASMLSGLGYTQDSKGMFVAPKDTAGTSADMSGQANAFQSFMNAQANNKPVSQEDIYSKTLRESGVRDAQREVNQYTSQLNAIVAKSQAEQLALEGQGRGVTESIIGGQQAQINREAAIAALPIQAQLTAAQGNLEFAQKQLDTMFSLRVADATANYNYKSNLISSVYNFATTVEQARLNALKTKEDRSFAQEQQNLAMAQEWAKMAVSTGQTGLITAFTSLNPKSATFTQDLGKLQAQIRQPSSGSAKRDTQVVDGKLIDMQTGEVINDFAGANGQQQAQLNDTLSLARELLSDKTAGKSGAIGFGFQKFVPFGQTLGLQGDRTSFENKLNTLKANLTLDNLKLLKGPMSDKDLAFLQAIGSSLTPGMSEKSFNQEVTRIVNKLEEKVAVPSTQGTRVITAPDGREIEIID